MAKVSMIVPVYNVEKYLDRCIESILKQTFEDYELVLVDDGSPDCAGLMCDEYAQADSRITVIHSCNGGVSHARNTGLTISTGEFITFCDSDDYLEKSHLECLTKECLEKNAQLACSGFVRVNELGEIMDVFPFKAGCWKIATEEECIDYIIHQILLDYGNGWCVCSSLFKRRIIFENGICFCEKCDNFAEDMGFMLEYMLFCKSVSAISSKTYNYFIQRSESMMNRSIGVVKLNELNEVAIQFGNRFFREIKKRKNRKRYAILYYLIMHNQYGKMNLYGEECKKALTVNQKIENIHWHDHWMRKLLSQYRETEKIFGKQCAWAQILNARLLANRNWNQFILEDYIVFKILKKGLKNSHA